MKVNIIEPDYEEVYFNLGDVFVIEGFTYMIARRPDEGTMLVSLETGGLWTSERSMPEEEISLRDLLDYVGDGVSIYRANDVSLSLTKGEMV